MHPDLTFLFIPIMQNLGIGMEINVGGLICSDFVLTQVPAPLVMTGCSSRIWDGKKCLSKDIDCNICRTCKRCPESAQDRSLETSMETL